MKLLAAVVVSLASAAATTAAYAQKPPKVTTSAVMIVDSVGKVVGRAVAGNGGSQAGVLVAANGVTVGFAMVSIDWGLIWGGGHVFFQTRDCSGTGYIPPNQNYSVPGSSRLTSVLKVGNRAVGYIAAPGPAQQVTVFSYLDQVSFCNTDPTGTMQWGTPVESTVDLDSLGIGPFFLN